jgi:hypothetical protein
MASKKKKKLQETRAPAELFQLAEEVATAANNVASDFDVATDAAKDAMADVLAFLETADLRESEREETRELIEALEQASKRLADVHGRVAEAFEKVDGFEGGCGRAFRQAQGSGAVSGAHRRSVQAQPFFHAAEGFGRVARGRSRSRGDRLTMIRRITADIVCDGPQCAHKTSVAYKFLASELEHHAWRTLPGDKHLCFDCARKADAEDRESERAAFPEAVYADERDT